MRRLTRLLVAFTGSRGVDSIRVLRGGGLCSLLVGATLSLTACGGDSSDGEDISLDTIADGDGTSPDLDTDSPDSTLPDGNTEPDSTLPDGDDGSDTNLPDTGPEPDSSEPPDTSIPDADTGGTPDADTGDVADGDATSPDTRPEPTCEGPSLEAGCPCDSDEACTSGFCAVGIDSSYCLSTCQGDSDCATGERCVVGSDGEGLCLIPADTLCLPCQDDSACQAAGGAGRCISYGEMGSFCATECSASSDCPDGFDCQSGMCRPTNNTCECTDIALELGASTSCTNTNGFGSCEGVRTCGPNGLSACSGPQASAEVCDGIDNNCNGQVDENASALCDDGNVCTADSCLGTLGCSHTPQAGSCDDGNSCTSNDSCHDGQCQGGANTCACSVDSDCLGQLPEGYDAACVVPSCNAGYCSFTFNTSSCDDGNVCTLGDTCQEGHCVSPSTVLCDDGNPCTDDMCGEQGCSHIARNSGSCEDGNSCTTGDVCMAGECVPGDALNCSALDGACFYGVCDGTGGCQSEPLECGERNLRLHVPATSFSRLSGNANRVRGAFGFSGPTGSVSNGVHIIHFGFHPGLYR